MPKIKAKNSKGMLEVKVKLLRGELLAERDLSVMSQRGFRGLLKPVVIKTNILKYSGPQGVSLADYLKQPLTGYDFHYTMAQIVRLERKLNSGGLPIKHLIVDLSNIYINPYTKELQFIYLPLSTGFPQVAIRELMETIICQWRPAPEEDRQYTARFLAFIRGLPNYMPDQILSYIKWYDARVAERLRKTQTSVSGFITNKPADYYSHYGPQGAPRTDMPLKYDPKTDLLVEEQPPPGEETGLLDEETGLLDEENGLLDEETGLLDEETGLLDEETGLLDEETGLLDESQPPQRDRGTEMLYTEQFPQWQEETGLLDENVLGDTELMEEAALSFSAEGKTDLLGTDILQTTTNRIDERYPYLIRRSMNERISINKPVFRIGKERSYVDCFISNNGAISRSHADIIKRGNRYFVCDRNSTNKTYRNGYMLTPEDEVEIFDGDILQLANEEFEFHMS